MLKARNAILEISISHLFEDWCFLKFWMVLTCFWYCNQNAMIYQTFCTRLIIFWYALYFWEYYYQSMRTYTYIRRRRRKAIAPWKWRTPPYTFLFCLIHDGRKPKARIAEIFKFYSIENFQNYVKARNAFVQRLTKRIN